MGGGALGAPTLRTLLAPSGQDGHPLGGAHIAEGLQRQDKRSPTKEEASLASRCALFMAPKFIQPVPPSTSHVHTGRQFLSNHVPQKRHTSDNCAGGMSTR